MPITKNDLEEIFKYHPPDANQLQSYEVLRREARRFAAVILDCTPPSPDQTTAIRKLRECVMTANASIALHGKY